MFLRKRQGGASIGEHEWLEDGDVTEVPDSLGRALLASAPDEWTEVTESADSYEQLKVPELKALLIERGLETAGIKIELIERLIESDAAIAAALVNAPDDSQIITE